MRHPLRGSSPPMGLREMPRDARGRGPAPVFLAALVAAALASGCGPKNGGTSGPATTSATTGPPPAVATEIPVGEFDGLTGLNAGFGTSSHNGIQLGIDEVNAAGGVNGKQLKLYSEDDESQKDKVKTVVTKLITEDKVAAVLGEVASSRSIAAAPVCEQYGVPMISPSSTNPAVTVKQNGQVRDDIFRICFIDPFQGRVMAKFMRSDLKLDHVAVFRDVKQDYSKGLADFFIKTFTSMGGTITKDVSYSSGDTDFRAQLTTIKASNPQAVFVPGYYNEVGLIAQQARQIGLNVPLAGGDGWDDPSLLTVGGAAVNGCYFSDHYSVDSQDPRSKAFVAAYKKKFGGDVPNALSACGYDAARLLADALRRSKSLSGKDISEAIATTRNFPGVTGDITINPQHNADKPLVVLEIKNGKHVLVDTIKP